MHSFCQTWFTCSIVRSSEIAFVNLLPIYMGACVTLPIHMACRAKKHCMTSFFRTYGPTHADQWMRSTARGICQWPIHSHYIQHMHSVLIYINTKNCSLSLVLTATDQKLQKSLKRWYYPPSHCLNGNVMLRTALVTRFRQPLQMNDFATFDTLPFIPLHFLCTCRKNGISGSLTFHETKLCHQS